jgi:hypothetical protein
MCAPEIVYMAFGAIHSIGLMQSLPGVDPGFSSTFQSEDSSMRKAMLLLAVFGFVGLIWAQSPFDGTWKTDISKTQYQGKPATYLLQNGTYQDSSSVPKINIKADGTDQAVQGSKTYDTMAVKVVDDKTVEFTEKKAGKVVFTSKDIVSADGKTMTYEFTAETSKQPVTVKGTNIRVAAGPAGSHAISGSWRMQKVLSESESALMVTFKSTTDGLMVSFPTGGSYDAKFDGKDYPFKGSPNISTVSLTKVNDRSFDETRKGDGKIVYVYHWTVSADGKTMTEKAENKVMGRTTTYIRTKQ